MNQVSPDRAAPRPPRPAQLGLAARDCWIFGYGSLMWDPGFAYVRSAPALVRGYHRAFCIYSRRWRGSPEHPGLVLGLDRGGSCHGVAFLVAAGRVAPTLEALWEREMSSRVYIPKLVRARLPHATVEALAFMADRAHRNYAGRLTLEEVARRLVSCRGQRGPNLEYLERTIEHLARLGLEDRHLIRVLAATRRLGFAR